MAAAITISVVVIARDVHSLASQSTSNRATLNRTFAVLAGSVMADENLYGEQAATLLSAGGTLSRSTFASDLDALTLSGSQLLQRTALLAQPSLDGHVQLTLGTVTALRVDGVTQLFHDVGHQLQLPGTPTSTASSSTPQQEFVTSNQLWQHARVQLLGAPGHARLPASVFALASAPLTTQSTALISAPSLQPVSAATIATVAVTPAPFPSPVGKLVLPPTNSISFDVVVRNTQYITQPVTVHLTLQHTTHAGVTITQRMSTVIDPLGARAVTFSSLAVVPGETGVVNISLTGVPIASGGTGTKHYVLSIAPSPTS